MDANSAPEWFDGIKWLFAAFLLACAFVGPVVLGPMLERMKKALPPPPSNSSFQFTNPNQLAVVGGALADKEALQSLTLALNRLCTILEKKLALEVEETEEERLEKKIKELMGKLT